MFEPRERIAEAIRFAREQTATRPALANLHRELHQSEQRLQEPMRVAIVGLIKAGKSTLMNALLGQELVATGPVETTFNVNWLRYGERPRLEVHYQDGRPSEEKPVAELEALTRRADENLAALRGIRHIVVESPAPLLQTFQLIDTPGLESFLEVDSENTRAFLQMHGAELTAITSAAAADADAVLYLFSRGVATADRLAVEQFQGAARTGATPFNAIGVLTKVDAYASSTDDPLAAGQQIAQRLATDEQARRLFYTVQPVCGLLALGAQTLTTDEIATLTRLAALPDEALARLLRSARRFAESEHSIPSAARQRVLGRLGLYGVGLATQLLRTGTDPTALPGALLAGSGVPALRELIVSHFGNRAVLIKLSTCFRQIARACFEEQQRVTDPGDRRIVGAIAGRFEQLEASDPGFDELRLLRAYYAGELDLRPDEVLQVLHVTGEYGTRCDYRLGVAPMTMVEDMLTLALERVRYWRIRASDTIGTDPRTVEAADALARAHERVAYHLNEARKHLHLYE